MRKHASAQGLAPKPETQERVRALVERDGTRAASIALGVSREVVARIAAGLGCRRGSLMVAEHALAAIHGAADPAFDYAKQEPSNVAIGGAQ